MDANTYYIIGGIAVVFIIYIIFIRRIASKHKAKLLDELKSRYSGKVLTDKENRALALGAILFASRNEEPLEMLPRKINFEEYRQGIASQWGIDSPQSARETILPLLALTRSSEFDQMIQVPSAELSVIQKEIHDLMDLDMSQVESVKSTYAWDIGRAVCLSKWCFWLGYLTEAEAWEFINQAAAIAKEKGVSWTEYTVSFMLGRSIHGFGLEMVRFDAYLLLKGETAHERIKPSIYAKYPF